MGSVKVAAISAFPNIVMVGGHGSVTMPRCAQQLERLMVPTTISIMENTKCTKTARLRLEYCERRSHLAHLHTALRLSLSDNDNRKPPLEFDSEQAERGSACSNASGGPNLHRYKVTGSPLYTRLRLELTHTR